MHSFLTPPEIPGSNAGKPDTVEIWGKRIGRILGWGVAILLMIYLLWGLI